MGLQHLDSPVQIRSAPLKKPEDSSSSGFFVIFPGLGDLPSDFCQPEHIYAYKGDGCDRKDQSGNRDPRRQIPGFHVFLIIIQKQDVDQIDPKGESAKEVDDLAGFFFWLEMSVLYAQHIQEKGGTGQDDGGHGVGKRPLVVVLLQNGHAVRYAKRHGHTGKAEKSRPFLADADLVSVFVNVISEIEIVGVDPVADQRQVIVKLRAEEPEDIVDENRRGGDDQKSSLKLPAHVAAQHLQKRQGQINGDHGVQIPQMGLRRHVKDLP